MNHNYKKLLTQSPILGNKTEKLIINKYFGENWSGLHGTTDRRCMNTLSHVVVEQGTSVENGTDLKR